MRTPKVVLAVIAVAAVLFGLFVLDRRLQPADSSGSESSLLVLTWAPSLCRVESDASGCRSGRVGKLGHSFVLHGLWPQPREKQYCDVPKKSRDRKPVELPPDLQARLTDMMSDSAVLAPHEWYAHGSCSGVSPTEYFSIATVLAAEAIAVLDPLFDRNVGRQITSRAVREAFDRQLSAGAGTRVTLVCRDAQDRGSLVYEVRMSLPPVVQLRDKSPAFAGALADGPQVPPGCGQARLP